MALNTGTKVGRPLRALPPDLGERQLRRLEWLGLLLVALVVLGTPLAAFGYQAYRQAAAGEIVVLARIPESGNWSPEVIRVKQGQTVRLRLTSEDVTHGLLAPELDLFVDHISAGKYTTVEFTASKPGEYPFYCTVVCSPLHAEMIGKVIVEAE